MPENHEADAPAAATPQNEEGNGAQTVGEMFMEAITIVGSTMRSTFVEANRCIRSCVYPCKERCVKLYDDITTNIQVKGMRNYYDDDDESVLRFGEECDS
ncbi:mitochondrial carrier protein, putative [Babesia ovis]|uniref:Mitochondrial carrier protein, putative n=1 Tax=Babesia ovis TaxID=5869 RepID=A0A9W5TEL1_BABOV|nr:mitochondrial carrier protein, putative [Babesia ovis]